MDTTRLEEEIEQYGTFTFVRSSGPGGQNVNKVNTKVQLSIKLEELPMLTEAMRDRIEKNLAHRLYRKADGSYFIASQKERSQLANRRHAVKRMAELLAGATKSQRLRKQSSPTKASKLRRLEKKKLQSRKKADRKAVSID